MVAMERNWEMKENKTMKILMNLMNTAQSSAAANQGNKSVVNTIFTGKVFSCSLKASFLSFSIPLLFVPAILEVLLWEGADIQF